MRQVALADLENKIVRPGFEAHLLPLLRFKGNQSLGRAHRMWNLFISGMEHEATAADITQRLVNNSQYSHLCGPENKVAQRALRSFAGRLLACPQVLKEERGLREYIREMLPPYKGPFYLTPIIPPPPNFAELAERRNPKWAMREFGVGDSIARRWFAEVGLVSAGGLKRRPDDFAELAAGKSLGWAVERYDVTYSVAHRWFDEIDVAPTRIEREKKPVPKGWVHFAAKETNADLAERFGASPRTVQRWRLETGVVCHAQRRRSSATGGNIVYPFLIHDGGKPEHVLLRKVNAAVPMHLEPELRADICQDLMVGILCGDLDPDDLSLPAKEIGRKVQQMFPTKYGPLSLDAVMPGTDSLRLIDTLSDENNPWEMAG